MSELGIPSVMRTLSQRPNAWNSRTFAPPRMTRPGGCSGGARWCMPGKPDGAVGRLFRHPGRRSRASGALSPHPGPLPSGERERRKNAETVYVFTKSYCGTDSRGERVEEEHSHRRPNWVFRVSRRLSLSTPERMEQQNLRSAQDDLAGAAAREGHVGVFPQGRPGYVGRLFYHPGRRSRESGALPPHPGPLPSGERGWRTVYVFTESYCGTDSRGERVEEEHRHRRPNWVCRVA